jgi:hypothetical protein
MAEYLIEVRLAGYAREYLRRLLYSAARRFRTGRTSKEIQAPAITLYGPFKTDSPEEVLDVVGEVAGRYDLVPYRIKGFKRFEVERKWLIFNHGMKGIYLDVEPSDKLLALRKDLADRLDTLCGGTRYDKDLNSLHAGIDLAGMEGNFEMIFSYLKENEEVDIIQRLVRITVRKNDDVLCEYDMSQRRYIGRRVSSDTKYLRMTKDVLRITEGEALKPIWLKAREVARGRSKLRQVTLVEDDPAIRLPRIFVPGRLKMHKRGITKGRSRQTTLVEDNPRIRIPRILLVGLPKIQNARGSGKSTQTIISLDACSRQPMMPLTVRQRIQELM